MTTLLSRQFIVDLPLEQAWRHLARAERWPTWARHISKVELMPPGEVGPDTKAQLTLTNGVKSSLTMTEFHPQQSWKWVGSFLWITIAFDHRFEALGPTQTRLTWVVEATGFGVSAFKGILANFYGRNLDRAIPLLVEEMHAGT
ncbi:MAG TPA: SRPBCC family protein [Pirellulaceae bacterium]|nr:SRPBCC family protein [Pirellulaceae bacterium]